MKIQPEMILQSLNGALRNRNLYPPEHPAIAVMTKKTHAQITDYLKGKSSAFFGIMNETFVFDDFPIIDTGSAFIELVRRMTDKHIEAMVFENGFTVKELAGAMDILFSEKSLEIEELEALVKAKGLRKIKLKLLPKGKRNVLEIYNDAIEVVKNVMGEIRMGKLPSAGAVSTIVEEMADSVFSDPNAMIGLTMIKEYDDYLYTHCVNVGVLAISVGKTIGLSEEDLHKVGVGALLHDVGKTAVDEKIIKKPAALSSDEWEKVKAHPVLGSNIAERMDGMNEDIRRIIYEHHIKFDHSGYPETTTKLHPLTQIVTIADAYDALTTLRVYQRPYQPLEGVALMSKFSGKHFDPEILSGFIKTIGLYPVGTLVRLESGEVGIVTEAATETNDTALLKIIYGSDGQPITPPEDRLYSLKEDGDLAIVPPEEHPADLVDMSAFFEKLSREHKPKDDDETSIAKTAEGSGATPKPSTKTPNKEE